MKNEFMFLLSCVAFASPCMSAQPPDYTRSALIRMRTDLTKDVEKLEGEANELKAYNENARRILANDIFDSQEKLKELQSSCAAKEGMYERCNKEYFNKIHEYSKLFGPAFRIVANSVCERLYDVFGVKRPPDFSVSCDVVSDDGDRSLQFLYQVVEGDEEKRYGDYKDTASKVAEYVANDLRDAKWLAKQNSMGTLTPEEQETMEELELKRQEAMGKMTCEDKHVWQSSNTRTPGTLIKKPRMEGTMKRETDAVEKKKKELEGIIETLDCATSILKKFIKQFNEFDKIEFERLTRNISMVFESTYIDEKYYVIIMDSDMAEKAFGAEKAELIREAMWKDDSKLTIRNDECGFLTYNQKKEEVFFSFKWIADMLKKAAQSLFRPNN